MEQLDFVERGTTKLYCFVEICDQLFRGHSRSAVRSWLKILEVNTIFATLDERRYFKSLNPNLKSTTFGLLYENDLKNLIAYGNARRPRKSADTSLFKSSSEIATDKLNDSKTASDGPVPHDEESNSEDDVAETCRTLVNSYSTTCSIATSSTAAITPSQEDVETRKQATITSTQEIIQTPTVSTAVVQSSTTLDKGNTSDATWIMKQETKKKDRAPYRMSEEEAGDNVKEEVRLLRNFYSVELNPKRDGLPFSACTIAKLIERIYCFLYFCKHKGNQPVLSLALFSDEALILSYIRYLQEVRQLLPNTISAHLTAIINVIKFNFRNDRAALLTCEVIASCRRLQRQLSRAAKIFSRRKKEGICMKKSSQQFYFNHILDTIRNLRAKMFDSKGIEKARYLHDFVMLTTYLRACPGRSKDIWILQLFVESEENLFDVRKYLDKNVIVFRIDGTVCLIENDFKTFKSTGPRNLDLSDDEDLIYYLRQYVQARPSLMQAKSHDFFYVNYHGEPFRDSSSLCVYLGNLFEREVSVRVSTNDLRHAIVTYFKTIDESKDIQIRESLATLMKHSTRYQSEVYDDATQHDKTKQARQVMRKNLAANVFGEEDIVHECATSEADEDTLDLRPHVGDICALLDRASTASNINFFLGKVARYSSDGNEVFLMHLAQVEGSSMLYRLKPGSVWKESVKAVVYPIDVVYNGSEMAYELRTSAEDIYEIVKGN